MLDVIAFLTFLAADSLATYLIAIVALGAAGCVSVYAVNRLPKEDDPDTQMRGREMRTTDSVVIKPDNPGFKVLLHYAEGGQDLWHRLLTFDDAIRIGRQMARSHNVALVVDETQQVNV